MAEHEPMVEVFIYETRQFLEQLEQPVSPSTPTARTTDRAKIHAGRVLLILMRFSLVSNAAVRQYRIPR